MHLDDLTGIFPYVYLFYFDAAGVNPSSIWGANLTYYYYDGDAHDLRVQDNIKENFHKLLTLRFHTFFNPCSKDDMFVVPGIIGKSSKRSSVVFTESSGSPRFL